MRRYLYSFYIKVMVFLLLLFPFIFSLICLILDTAQKSRIYIPGCIACFTCIIVYCLTLIITFILDKKSFFAVACSKYRFHRCFLHKKS